MSDETSGDVSVQELENATLTCKATGHPPPKITWRREDHEPVLLKKPQSRDFDKGNIYVIMFAVCLSACQSFSITVIARDF